MTSKYSKAAAVIGMAILAGSAYAQKAGDTTLYVGVAYIKQDVSVGDLTASAAAAYKPTYQGFVNGASAEASDETTVKFNVTHMVTNNIAVELAVGIAPRIQLDIATDATGNHKNAAEADVQTPSLLAKYFFFTPDVKLRPYVGLGATYVRFTDVKVHDDGPTGTIHRLAGYSASVDSTWAPVYNVGVSYKLNEQWSIGTSFSYIPIDTKMTFKGPGASNASKVDDVTTKGDVTFNSMIYAVNVGYTF